MRRTSILALASLAALAAPAQAQTQGGHHPGGPHLGGHAPPAGAYAGLEQRRIKALSDQQIADLRTGRGMGLALAAELNGYPGPLHVLELASVLALTGDQQARAKALLEAMKDETIPIGERIVTEEAALDRLFAERRITADALAAGTARIGALQGELRAAHLRYHLMMSEHLTPEQAVRYNERRGYRGAP